MTNQGTTTSAVPASPPPPAAKSSGGSALGMLLPVIIIVLVLVLGGVGTFFALPSSSSSTPSQTGSSQAPPSCQSNAPGVCSTTTSSGIRHDATLTPTYATAQDGTPVPFTVTLPGGAVGTSFRFWFGDGTTLSSTTPVVSHTYTFPGTFFAYVIANDTSGVQHDNLGHLVSLAITNSFASDTLGNLVETSGVVVSNSSASTNANPSVPSLTGGTVTVAAYVSSSPTNPSTTIGTPSFELTAAASAAGLKLGTPSGTGLSQGSPLQVAITVPANTPNGGYPILFEAPTELTTSTGTVFANSTYGFTVIVGPSAVSTPTVAKSPHPGTLDVYELAPGGSGSEDPAIDYETLGYEPIINVYQTLVSYNGSHAGPDPSDFVPNLATCVPGSNECATMYGGNNLASSNGDYTFVINSNSKFYDPSNGNSYNVWPTDVLFSFVRTCLFSTYPAYEVNPGWIQCQALLPNANVDIGTTAANTATNPASSTWDGGVHYPLNNTPSNILSAISINDTSSGDCPTPIPANGCVTFHTQMWAQVGFPYFLELVADPLGASVISCDWALTQGGVTIPGWSVGANGGCVAPSASSLQSTPTAWDSYQTHGEDGNYDSYLQWHMVGSGPYYLANIQVGQAYDLEANPGWAGPGDGVTGHSGDLPGAWSNTDPPYEKNVNVVWEPSQTEGEAAYTAGTADFASIPSTDNNFMLQLVKEGKIGVTSTPSLSIYFYPFDMSYDVAAAQSYFTQTINTPSYIMQDLYFRQFLIEANPYASIQAQINTVNGVQYEFPYGGAIPQYMGNYYASNISWPSGNPVSSTSVVGSAGYWWNLASHDAIFSNLTCMQAGQGPCNIPFFSDAGAPAQDAADQLFANEISSLTGGKVQLLVKDIPFINIVINSFSAPGQNPMPFFILGWAPDYPDPTDYVGPMYQPDSTYTTGDALLESLAGYSLYSNVPNLQYQGASGGFSATCPGTQFSPTVTFWCQGSAYRNMTTLLLEANTCTGTCTPVQRVLLYTMAENIAEQLGLYVSDGQANAVGTYASWINPNSLNSNPMIGGGGDSTWYTVQYAS